MRIKVNSKIDFTGNGVEEPKENGCKYHVSNDLLEYVIKEVSG